MAEDSTQKHGLFTIAQELRDLIWAAAVVGPTIIKGNKYPRLPGRDNEDTLTSFRPLSLNSKRVHDGVTEIFYGNNTFGVLIPFGKRQGPRHPNQPDAPRQALRRLPLC
jgi:hypothetical protein